MIAKEPEDFKKLAPGALLKFDNGGAITYGAIPLGVEVLPAGANPKVPLLQKWSGSGSGKTVAELASLGVEGWVPGVLSSGSAAGARAPGLKAGLLNAALGVPTGGRAAAIDSVRLMLGTASADKPIEEALKVVGLEWEPWKGSRRTRQRRRSARVAHPRQYPPSPSARSGCSLGRAAWSGTAPTPGTALRCSGRRRAPLGWVGVACP